MGAVYEEFERELAKLRNRWKDDFRSAFFTPEVRRFVSKMCAGYQGTLHRLPELYAKIECPTLVLWAEHDKHFPLVQAERLHKTIAQSHLQIIPNGTHWMAVCRAEELARHILNIKQDHRPECSPTGQ